MKHPASPVTCTHKAEFCTVSSEDGSLRIKLGRVAGGVVVERMQLRSGIAHVMQTALFTDEAGFLRWCDSGTLKFDHPQVHAALRRDGDALFRGAA